MEFEKQELHPRNENKNVKVLGLPLDKLKIEVRTKLGEIKSVSALHIGFSDVRNFVCYKPPPSIHISHSIPNGDIKGLSPQVTDQARIEEWLERMEFLEEDLHWLLHLPPHRFWSQVIYDESLQKCLESYLCYAPRYHDMPDPSITEEMSNALQHVHRLVFMVFLRMSTYKESKTAHLSQQAFGEIIYENFLFDIPKIMDLCVLYGRGNRELLQRMIKNIFEAQPFYVDDLEAAIPTVLDVFDTIQVQFGLDSSLQEENADRPRRLSDTIPSPLSKLSWSKLKDIIFYLVDASSTLSAFIDIYPPSTFAFHKQRTAARIANFYETVFPPLRAELQERRELEECKNSLEELKRRLLLAKTCLINTFRNIVSSCCIQPILNGEGSGKNSGAVEDFLQIMSTVVTEKSFIYDYQQTYPFEEDLEIISQALGTIDPTRIEYILTSIYSSFELFGKEITFQPIPALSIKESSENDTNSSLASSSDAPQVLDSKNDYSEQNGDLCAGACATPSIDGIELDCLVSRVLDVLSDLGAGFIEKCLEYYNYDAELVISVILDDNLPIELKRLDRKMQSSRHVIAERKNIYDNDEFDVFNRDAVDISRIHRGKRNTPLEDIGTHLKRDDSASLREVYRKYELVEDPLLYDDEYDDTYDDIGTETEQPHPGDVLYGRAVTIPRVLETRDSEEEDNSPKPSENENSETAWEQESGFEPDRFVENPAEVRNRIEQKRLQFQPNRRHDVKGRPRGQGQDQATLHNRQYKEKHKGSTANHNRRFQHERKYSRGAYHS